MSATRNKAASVAASVALATAGPGCVVRSWNPLAAAPGSELRVNKGDSVRAVAGSVSVELQVARYEPPWLYGREARGGARIRVDLAGATRVDVHDASRRLARGIQAAAVTAGDVIGRDVQLTTAEGPVALHVVALENGGVLVGEPRSCAYAGTPVTCTGLVRLDTRAFDRIEVAQIHGGRSAALTLVGGAIAALAVFAGLLFFEED